ncbi:MAG: matrixin family metalloprotease [Chitinophagales bacterium]
MLQILRLIPLLFLAACKPAQVQKGITTVAIQPIGTITKVEINVASKALDSVYHIKVVVLAPVEPPSSAFINVKTPRYRADKLIAWLAERKPDSADYIIGLTGLDISTTKTDGLGRTLEPKSRYTDFGIFGLGYCPGKSCIVSSFRLGTDKALAQSRLAKIAVHEFGHNLGLPHCKNESCVMADAVEKITTIDAEGIMPCAKCKRQLGL